MTFVETIDLIVEWMMTTLRCAGPSVPGTPSPGAGVFVPCNVGGGGLVSHTATVVVAVVATVTGTSSRRRTS